MRGKTCENATPQKQQFTVNLKIGFVDSCFNWVTSLLSFILFWESLAKNRFEIPGPVLVLLPVLPTINLHQNTNHGLMKRKKVVVCFVLFCFFVFFFAFKILSHL